MSISVRCHKCGQRYKVNPEALGRILTCQKCRANFQAAEVDERMPPPAGSGPPPLNKPASQSPAAAPPAPPRANADRLPPAIAPPAPVAVEASPRGHAPAAEPIFVSQQSVDAPVAQPVEIQDTPAAEEPALVGAATPNFGTVRADAMAEMLDEQEQEDDDRRGQLAFGELVQLFTSHKLLAVIAILSLFFVLDYLRAGELLLAFLFGGAAVGLVAAGLRSNLADGPAYQVFGFCFLVVLVAFPVLKRYQNELGLAGANTLRNPTAMATAVPRPARVSAAPPPIVGGQPPHPGSQKADAEASAAAPPGQFAAQPSSPAVATPQEPQSNGVAQAEAPRQGNPDLTAPAAAGGASAEPPSLRETPLGGTPVGGDELRESADKAFRACDSLAALEYLYADAIGDANSAVWQFFRWCSGLNRAALGLRLGAAVEMDEVSSQFAKVALGREPAEPSSLEAQRSLGTSFVQQTVNLNGPLAVTWIRSQFDEGKLGDLEVIRPPSVRDLRGATYLATDLPSEVLLGARRQQLDLLLLFSVRASGGGARPAISALVRAVDVATGREILASKPKEFRLAFKEVPNFLESLAKLVSLGEMPSKIELAPIQARFKALASKKGDNRLDSIAELLYYQREKKLPAAEIEKMMTALVGQQDAKALLSGSDGDRQLAAIKWLPKPKAQPGK